MNFLLPSSQESDTCASLVSGASNDKRVTLEVMASWTRTFIARAIVYDAKTEQVSLLIAAGFDPEKNLFILNPLDTRCWGWDVSKDIVTREEIEDFAAAIIPDSDKSGASEKDEFFKNNSRALIIAVVHCFINAAKQAEVEPAWTLLDVIQAIDSKDDLRRLIEKYHPNPKRIFSQILDNSDQRTYGNIFASLATRMRELGPTAHHWHEAILCGKGFSLRR